MDNNKMFYRPGRDNTEYYNLLTALRKSGTCKNIPESSNGWFYTYHAEFNGVNYKIMDDIENGIPYSIEILN
jgi:hypothetical protein